MAAWLILIGLPWLTHAWLYLVLIVARLELGRWPNRWGLDDPNDIPIVSALCIPLWILMVFTGPAYPILVICTFLGAVAHDWRLGLRMLAAAAVAWGALYLIGDPANVWVWFFD